MTQMKKRKPNARIIFTLLTVIIIITAFCIAAIAEKINADSYAMLFSKQTPFLAEPLYTVNQSYVNSLVLNEQLRVYYTEEQLKGLVFDHTDPQYGDLYIKKDNKVLEKLSEGNYTLSCDDSYLIYAVEDDTKVYVFDINTKSKTLILTAKGEIKDIHCADDLIFYQVGNDIFRYHKPTKTNEKIYTDENIYAWRPITNIIIQIMYENKLYYDFIEKADCGWDDVIPDFDGLIEWYRLEIGKTAEEVEYLYKFRNYPLTEIINDILQIPLNYTEYYPKSFAKQSTKEYLNSEEYNNILDEFHESLNNLAQRLDE